MLDDFVLPAWSVALTVIGFEPGLRVKLHENGDCNGTTVVPLHVRAAGPESESVAVPVTSRDAAGTIAPSDGVVIVTVGGVLSILNDGEVTVALLPAASVTV